jgi:ribosomal-protein-alanine N-acetyltransferase
MIRPLVTQVTASHAPVLAAIHCTAFPPSEAWSTVEIASQTGMPGAFGLLDQRGGMLLGRVTADEAEILTLAVIPEQRRRGLAMGLLLAALAHAGRHGARAMFLEVATTNPAARALYARAGFEEVGQRRCYYADGSDALVLRAAIRAPASRPDG